MRGYIEIVNWKTFQHYKHRNPTWIKSYSSLLSCYEYTCLQDDSKLLYHTLLLMAGRFDNKIPLDPQFIQSQGTIRANIDLQPLVNAGFIKCYNLDSTPIEVCYNPDSKSVAQRREEKSREEKSIKHSSPTSSVVSMSNFDQFWKIYPRKTGKGAARRAWEKIKPTSELYEKILQAVEQQKKSMDWQRENGKYIPHPTTWLNQERWDDEVRLSAIEEWKQTNGIQDEGAVA